MQIEFYTNFRKRENSTKLPTGTADKVLTGYLREPCSMENPVFNIKRLSSDDAPDSYVYASIPRFGRKYFVTDWIWNNGLWECHLQEDYLGTWRTYIGATSAYVERSASAFNGAIIDRVYPATTNFNTVNVPLTSSYNGVAPSGGCFVLGIVNNANFAVSQAGGAVTYYAMTVSQMRSLMHYLLGTGFLTDAGFPATPNAAQQLMQDTAKAFINPAQYIVSCMWFPVSATAIGENNATSIVLGYWDLDSNVARGHKLTSFAYTADVEGNIPVHPLAATRGKYLNYAPYTRLTLHIPPFGSIPLDTSFCEIGSFLEARVYVDTITGKAQMRVRIHPDDQHQTSTVVVAEASAMFGVPIQMSQMTPDYFAAFASVLSSSASIASGIMSGVPGAGDLAAIMSIPSAGNALDALMPQERVAGVSGSFLQNILEPTLTAQHFNVVDEDNTEIGRPLCEVRVISTLSGFIKCGEASVDYPCFATEKTRILNYMTQGFYWE